MGVGVGLKMGRKSNRKFNGLDRFDEGDPFHQRCSLEGKAGQRAHVARGVGWGVQGLVFGEHLQSKASVLKQTPGQQVCARIVPSGSPDGLAGLYKRCFSEVSML